MGSEIKFENYTVSCEFINKKSFAYIKNEDISVLILFDPINDLSVLHEKYQNPDVIISRNDYPNLVGKTDCVLTVINAENSRGIILQNELKSKVTNFAATAGCGDIIIKADKGYISSYRDD